MPYEKGHEQRSSGQRGSLLECHEAACGTESRYGMPKMKGLKELTLLVSNEPEAGGQRGFGELLQVAPTRSCPPAPYSQKPRVQHSQVIIQTIGSKGRYVNSQTL